MTRADEYSQQEIRELIEYLGQELRDRRINEDEFRRSAAKYGYPASEIDSLVREALQPT